MADGSRARQSRGGSWAGLARIVLLVVLAGSAPAAFGATVVLEPVRDNTLYEHPTGALSNGAGDSLYCGTTSGNWRRRALLAFDVAGNVPAGAQIASARLQLRMTRTIAGPFAVELRRLTADWGEGTSDAEGSEGDGAAATLGDATWIHSFWATTTWATVGGDFAATPSATQTVDDIATYTWGPTAEMASDVQDWLESPAANFGWVLLGYESDFPTAKRFNSRENNDTPNRPKLEIVYLVAIFHDGFESGDVAEWSLVEPPG
ncbi:MAG: DNRLRE domain-containing protein [Thermoanaerobaculia bacterium]|jgi:hypothetical protein|nr:DNRLRE domain-containing protein [Thermoanaerobaculia bacterium]MBP9824637.1 DNRLRE domain-containing protein [Thermoanaerobaculia bacterium]